MSDSCGKKLLEMVITLGCWNNIRKYILSKCRTNVAFTFSNLDNGYGLAANYYNTVMVQCYSYIGTCSSHTDISESTEMRNPHGTTGTNT